MSQRYLILDYETRSASDLKAVGAYEYSMHPSTRVLCVAWRVGTRNELKSAETEIWSPALSDLMPLELAGAFVDEEVIIIAHNAYFEQVITKNVLARDYDIPEIPPDRWLCTASLAAAMALPRSLHGVSEALHLTSKKDMEGHRLMMKLARPRQPTKDNPAVWHNRKSDLLRLMSYCQADINAEVELFLKLPPLTETERRVWILDQKINLRGVGVDRALVKTVFEMIREEYRNLSEEIKVLTEGKITSTAQRDKTLKYIQGQGVEIDNLRSKTVTDLVAGGTVSGDAKRVLQIRQDESRTSTAKYRAFWGRSSSDGRARDHLLYHAASTGRWGGAGIQPQNLVRSTIKDVDAACEVLATGDLAWVRALYGSPLEVFSSCLRSMIIPSSDKEFFCADYAAIETRVLFWLADHADGLTAYAEGRDLYKEMASKIYRRPVEGISKAQRELGKRAILGCGYGMGAKKFHITCTAQNQPVEMELAELAVKTYRETHDPIPRLWKDVERAGIAAVTNLGKSYRAGRCRWFVEGDFLFAELPSNRRLAYYKPEIRYESPWKNGEKKATLYHWGSNSLNKKWECASTYGGKLAENITQAVARDLLAEAMLRIEEAGYTVVLTVHDEIVAERTIGEGKLNEFEDLMAMCPSWARDLPVKAEGWTGPRYRK